MQEDRTGYWGIWWTKRKYRLSAVGSYQSTGNDTCRTDKIYQKPVDRKGTGKRSHRNYPVPELQSIGIGEVNRPGTFEITSDRITLLDALSLAGDLTIYGQRENIKVVREENGERVVVSLDLRNKDLLSSPYYYLQQNDVVYVEPNKVKAGQREINQNRTIGTFASILSVMVSLAVLIFK